VANRATLRYMGTHNLRSLVKRYGQDVIRHALAIVGERTQQTAQRARAAAPVDTGDLVNSISATVRTDGYLIRGVTRVGVPYAAHVEFGTERTTQHPHLVPAAIDERRTMQEQLQQILVNDAPADLGRPRIVGREVPLPDLDID